jgi:type II secretory pathway component PulJ
MNKLLALVFSSMLLMSGIAFADEATMEKAAAEDATSQEMGEHGEKQQAMNIEEATIEVIDEESPEATTE